MQILSNAEQRALTLLQHATPNSDPAALIGLLRSEGLVLADSRRDEMVCRWVSVAERAVPPDADTIIRTITRTQGSQTFTSVHWLEGLRGPSL